MNMNLTDTSSTVVFTSTSVDGQPVIAFAAWHALAWLVFANGVGVLIALLLLFPRLNAFLGERTYGCWMPVHINLQLYGWCSLPLVAFLFNVYRTGQARATQWCRPILWLWSSALACGALSWLTGHSSGKLFLDWTGYSRVLFPLAQIALWSLLAFSFTEHAQNGSIRLAKLAGLCLLLVVPIAIYVAASPSLYPPVNPDTGGPTGASQLESTLVIIAILLLLPFGLAQLKANPSSVVKASWAIFAAECLLCLALGRTDISHHRPTQYISLGSLLLWLPLTPAYYSQFGWHKNTYRWRFAFLAWWSVLVPTGWCLFLPGVLDRFKFTDGLVGHSLLAMAGFVSSLLAFILVQLLGDEGWIFNRPWSFYVWQGSVIGYVLLMFFAGWREGADPAFSMVPGDLRNVIYSLRLMLGTLMLVASAEWLLSASRLLHTLERAQ